MKHSGDKILIVSLYVDDLIFTRNDEEMFGRFKESNEEESCNDIPWKNEILCRSDQ